MIMDGHGGVGSVTMETRGREEPRVYASYQSIISGILRVILVVTSLILESFMIYRFVPFVTIIGVIFSILVKQLSMFYNSV